MKSFAKNTSLGSDTNDEIVDTNDEILIPNKKDINDNIFKTSMQNQLKEVIKEKKQKFYEFKNSDNKNSEQQQQTTMEIMEERKGNIQMAQQSLQGTPF